MPIPENKTKVVNFRFRPSELAQLDAAAASVNLTRSEFITRKLQGLPVQPTRVPAVNWKLYRELATIAKELPALGNNINQIAKALNTASQLGQPISQSVLNSVSIAEIDSKISETKALLKEIRLTLIGVTPSK